MGELIQGQATNKYNAMNINIFPQYPPLPLSLFTASFHLDRKDPFPVFHKSNRWTDRSVAVLLFLTPKSDNFDVCCCTFFLGQICATAHKYQYLDTVDIGYMVLWYMVISDIWSILPWYRFPCTKIYLIYGQISDILSETLINCKTKAIEWVANLGYFTETIVV